MASRDAIPRVLKPRCCLEVTGQMYTLAISHEVSVECRLRGLRAGPSVVERNILAGTEYESDIVLSY